MLALAEACILRKKHGADRRHDIMSIAHACACVCGNIYNVKITWG